MNAPSPFALTVARLRVAFAEGTPLWAHAWLSVLFVAARAAFYAAGLRMNFDLGWMWLADPGDLRDRLFHTLFYFHAMPPGMNVVAALCLKLGGASADTVALVLFGAFTLVLANALFYLGRTLGLPVLVAFLVALGFGLSPPALFFDHLFLYESPVVALLTLGAALFLHALRAPSLPRWLAFFLTSAVTGFLRSTFHLLWLGALVGIAVHLVERRERRTVLLAALGPALLLFALYAKNLAVFGFFGAFSEAPLNFNLVTTHELPREARQAWIQEGKLSRFAAVDVFAGPRAYLPFFERVDNPAYPPELSLLERPTNGAPNYNHWFFLAAMPERRHDAWVSVTERPGSYLRTVAAGFIDLFSPTTRWHPGERAQRATPHDEHRRVLGGYETAYNTLLHGFPFPPFGLYLLLPIVAWSAVRRMRAQWAAGDVAAASRGTTAPEPQARASRANAGLLGFALFQIAYAVVVSTLFSFKESARYRYQVEPLLWLLAAMAAVDGVRRLAQGPYAPGRPRKSS